ncbi:XdhC family protein [Zobellia galactanivorans]|uniref:XdhC family protein n=1 Tax=Zobellia galactanivorans (strain DSM 12802 / CCUG 47099 / CIP 106680 / NCIMB 13871 / Dsij) TaxID=63186 RepID=G0L308_ZOBGA|nr:XdhC/CoxI family protein [Zobellia galactanivorans]MBU3024995.1 XdhC family protein [Zobellia galactanivorans]CAZ98313.1 XdhC family protein [Zobellia galactanivorans]
MTHELKNIIRAYKLAKEKKQKTVLATVVALEGSSYRRPGVRMLIREDGKMIGAVSGGCVEKEIFRQAHTVFNDDVPKMMIYDGRYRLGCEGILYILIEPFAPSTSFIEAFELTIKHREQFTIRSSYIKKEGSHAALASFFVFGKNRIGLRPKVVPSDDFPVFEQQMNPCFKLIIIGAEHDAVQLCSFASLMGWEVTIVASAAEEKNINDFPGADLFLSEEPEMLSLDTIDEQTAIVLMTHSYVRDLKYLLAIRESKPVYLGLLGPAKRREKLLNEFIEHYPEVVDTFFDAIHGPAGLDIGAETAQEIALAILSEILSVTRGKEAIMLKNKLGRIHT